MITVADALAAIASVCEPLGTEDASLADAVGRVLAREVRSDVDWPPFDTSAMDGYAVRAADLGEAGLTIPERPGLVAAGDPPPPPIREREAVRIMTGAPLPEGADAVVPVERSRRDASAVRFEAPPEPGVHVRRRGESVAAGTVLLPAGKRLTAGDVALAALAGAEPVTVYRRPRIVIAATGNELVASDRRPSPGQLRDSNGPMLAALCRRLGWPAKLLSGIRDERAALERLFAGESRAADVLVTSGGVSAGDLDLLPGVARDVGFELLFSGVAVRPGKPLVVGRRNGAVWFGLPGNPVSSSVGFHLFAREGIARREGDRSPAAPRVPARLAASLSATGARETYRDGRWTLEEAESRVLPIRSRGSHDIAAHANANALIRTAAGSPPMPAGSIVECVLLDGGLPTPDLRR